MKIIFSSIKNNDIFETDFAHLSSQNGTIEFKHMQGSGGIAVIYAPNGTGKTSLANLLDVEVSTEKNSFVASDDQGNTITPETMAFHVIQDQLNRNVIRGKTTDYLIGAQIRREYELRDQINAAFRKRLSIPTCSKSMKNCTTGIKVLFCAGRSRWGRSLMDFLVSLVGRTLLNLKTFLDGTEMMEDSLYEGQMRYIPEEAKEDKNFVEKIVYVSPIRHAEGNFYLSQILAYPEMYEQMLQVLKEYDEDIISINYDDERTQNIRLDSIKRSRTLKKDENLLTIR